MRVLLLACAAIGLAASSVAHADDAARQPLYYQDPDGKSFYAFAPRKTAYGRDDTPVFGDGPAAQTAVDSHREPQPSASGDRRVPFYRSLMGRPDTSPKPKKDIMGMDDTSVFDRRPSRPS